MFWNGDARPELIDVAVGLLDAESGARAEEWIEFTYQRLSFREDGVAHAESMTKALEEGMREFERRAAQ